MWRKIIFSILLNLILVIPFGSTSKIKVTQKFNDDHCDVQLKLFRDALLAREFWAIKCEFDILSH